MQLLTHSVTWNQTNSVGMYKRIQPWKSLLILSREELILILSLITKGPSDPEGRVQTGRTSSESQSCRNTEQSSAAAGAEANKAEIWTEAWDIWQLSFGIQIVPWERVCSLLQSHGSHSRNGCAKEKSASRKGRE